MRKLIMIAAATATAAVLPALADAQNRGRGHGKGHAVHARSHPHGCPPGLANRTPRCIPPGQARRMFRQGQRVPASYRDYVGYNTLIGRLPVDWRDDIPVGNYRYIYRDNTVYVVNPRTRLINRIIDIVL